MENNLKIPPRGDEQFVISRTFRHVGRSSSVLWVKVRTRLLTMSYLDTGPKSGQACKSLTYIIQTIWRITLINLVMGIGGREGGGSENKERQKSNKYFISFWTCGVASACAWFASLCDDFTTRPPAPPPSELIHLQLFSADEQTMRDQSLCQRSV